MCAWCLFDLLSCLLKNMRLKSFGMRQDKIIETWYDYVVCVGCVKITVDHMNVQ